MASILPKGIVVNTEEISDDIEPDDGEPVPDVQVARLWKVYTTTHRRLLDPTAERLENYWWRIWGSRSRQWNGSTVSRLFHEIADGPTFAPLRGPPNRDESGGRQHAVLRPDTSVAVTSHRQSRHESDSSGADNITTASREQSSRPPPILKKSSGPLTTGPRPTARFVSPHSSQDDIRDSSSDRKSRSQDPMSSDVVRRKTKPVLTTSSDASTGPRRRVHGFVATNAGHKRRPGLPRRPTPHSSPDIVLQTTEESLSAATSRSEAAWNKDSDDREATAAVPKEPSHSKFQENFSLSPEKKLEITTTKKTQSSIKRKSKILHGQDSNSTSTSNSGSRKETFTNLKPREPLTEAGPSRVTRSDHSTQDSSVCRDDLNEDELKELELQEALLAQAKTKMLASKGKGQVLTSNTHRETVPGLTISSWEEEKPPVVGTDASLDALPAIFTNDSSISDPSGSRGDGITFTEKGKGKAAMKSGEEQLFEKRLVQSVSAASNLFASPPQSGSTLGRSKSQLTLLLEQDRAKSTGQQKGGDREGKHN